MKEEQNLEPNLPTEQMTRGRLFLWGVVTGAGLMLLLFAAMSGI